MNELYDEKCRKCKCCKSGYWCDVYNINPALALEECLEDDFIKFKEKEED